MIGTSLPARIDAWFAKDSHATFYERIDALMESEPFFRGLPYPVRYARTLRHILEAVSVYVQPGESIVGSAREIIPSREQVEAAEMLSRAWWDKPVEAIQRDTPFFYSRNWLRRRPPWFHSFGHLGLIWEDLVGLGIGGLRARAEAVRAALGAEEPEEKRFFLQGAVECYDAISDFIRRYATTARAEADCAGSPADRIRLSAMAESLDRIASRPPTGFREALQLLWLTTFVLQKVCGCGVLNFSRMDQYLLALFRRDLDAGVLDREAALALVEEFFFKNNEIMAPVDHMSLDSEGTQFTLEVTFDDPNYLTVGGLLPDGTSGVNELSTLLLEANHRLRLRNPFMIVRYHEGIDGGFMKAVCAAMRDNATVVVYNDGTMIPALRENGVEERDVCNYGFFGCNDPDLPGEAGALRQLWWNLAKPLELALQRGDYPMQPRGAQPKPDCAFSLENRMTGLMTGAYYGVETPDLDTVRDMDAFLDLYRTQSMYLMREYRRGFEKDIALERELFRGHFRIEDCFLHGTVENAVTWTLGGTRYHKIITQGTGLATVVDSLYALEEVVFREREMSLKEFAAILAANFAGHEALRERLSRKTGKFGNDLPRVDRYARAVVDIFCDCVRDVNGAEYLYQLIPTLSSDRDFTTMGRSVGATPDGRRHGDALSENQSPTQGMDVNGVTALLNSLATVPFARIAGGPLNVKIHPGAIAGEAGLANLCALLKTYFQKGGMQVQLNVLDRAQLLEAQREPEKHRNLCIRVTGYSAFFTQMGEKAQNELIGRTEQIFS